MLVVSTVTTKSDIGHFVHSLIHHQLPSNNCLLLLRAKKLRLNLMLVQPFKGNTKIAVLFYLGGVGPRVSMTGRAHSAAQAAAPEPVSTTGFHLTTQLVTHCTHAHRWANSSAAVFKGNQLMQQPRAGVWRGGRLHGCWWGARQPSGPHSAPVS